MARLRHTARKFVIPFLPSRLAERPLRRLVAGQSNHLERLHHRLHEEQERRRQEQEQQGSSFSLHQEIESVRSCSPVLPLEAPPAPPLGALASGVAAGGDPDDGGGDDSSSHDTDFSTDQEPEGWVARPITRDTARGCHFHDALETLLRRALNHRTWSIEYRCVVCSEHYSISERDSAEAAMQDAARRALSHYCSVLGGVADGLNLKYYPRRPSGSTGGVIVSPVGEDNPRLSNTVNLAAVLNTELDHALDELSRARAEVALLRAEHAERRHLDDGSPAPVGTQHPYRSPRRGRQPYGNPDCRTRINLEP
jgi:hypothetical protein